MRMNGDLTPGVNSEIGYEILAYLAEHPAAEDTVEGIMRWWLLERKIKHLTIEVQTALAEMVGEGLILARQGRDGRIHHRINGRKVKEINELLNQRTKKAANHSRH